jgi:LacI family transcriptional regulator
MVGAVIPTLKHAIYASLVEALQQELGAGGYSLVIATSEYQLDQEVTQAQLLLERGAEGIVLVGGSHDPRLHPLLDTFGVAYTHAYIHQEDRLHPCVGFDNRAAGGRIADFLVTLGHRRVAMIAGITAGNDRAGERLEGLRDGLEAHG